MVAQFTHQYKAVGPLDTRVPCCAGPVLDKKPGVPSICLS